ncbi:MAG: PD-(D/E)XK nuclease family protein [Candidatus Parcubacteria bacterium]|nr:PD-(D/E)XK nuclease family protein [Candidatus Parcubacteria bacterium]
MTTYSHSKVSTFENCPYQYKLRYVEKEAPEVSETIEIFMGKRVHETLEKLYKDKKFKKLISKTTLLKFYKDNWEKEISDDILVVKKGLTAKNYKKMGIKFIEDYYDKYKPFDQLTILGLETQDRMTLKDGNQWHVRIDKFACDDKGNYYVCDYKTNSSMKDQEEADEDRQLAMYSIWVKDKFKDVKSVKLVWYMLAFNKEAVSERTEEQLKKLEDETVTLIQKIELATKENDFPTRVTALCDYCGFKSQCPSFKHKLEIEVVEEVKKFKEDDGVKFVDKFSEIKIKLKELESEEDELKENLIAFAKSKGIDIIYGSNMKCSVKEIDKIVLPEDKEELINMLKSKGIWEEFSSINFMRLQSKVLKDEIDKEIKKMIDIEKDYRLSLSKRKDVEEE